jgi:methanogenic corrinoid protein MtbC1
MSTIPSTPSEEAGLKPSPRDSADVFGWNTIFDAAIETRSLHRADGLVTMVESEIIPRLMLAHRTKSYANSPSLDPVRIIGDETAEAFARMVVSKESESLIEFVGGLLQSGVALDTIYTELLVPAARRLGEYWDEDSVSFTDVTVGLGRLQQVVRALGCKPSGTTDSFRVPRSVFFAAGPHEQHMFGLFIVEDVFRRAGWRTWLDASATSEDLVETVRAHWFDVFGLSVSTDAHIDEVARTVQLIRQASRNPNIFVLVGGRLFLDQPGLVSAVSADATASTGGEALLIANHALLIASNEVSALTHAT